MAPKSPERATVVAARYAPTVRWGLGVLAILVSWPLSAAAQHYQLFARGDVLMCETIPCAAEGEDCMYGDSSGTCMALVSDALICAAHSVEVFCCNTTSDCPAGTECHDLETETFGVCVGGEYPLTFCAEQPYDAIDLARCRDPNLPSMYDWGHGDCDGDGDVNDSDETPCEGVVQCPCDADVDTSSGGDYDVDLTDIGRLSGCLGMLPEGACASADVNCDGIVDHCDVGAVARVVDLGLGEPENFVCAGFCGACEAPSVGCVQTTASYCAERLGGRYRGDNSACRDPDDGGIADADASSFRGGGGCACSANSNDREPAGGVLTFALALLFLLGLRKTA